MNILKKIMCGFYRNQFFLDNLNIITTDSIEIVYVYLNALKICIEFYKILQNRAEYCIENYRNYTFFSYVCKNPIEFQKNYIYFLLRVAVVKMSGENYSHADLFLFFLKYLILWRKILR